MIRISTRGNFKRTESFLDRLLRTDLRSVLNAGGEAGVSALSAATPVASGETANAWSYDVQISPRAAIITWTNSHVVNGAPIAILLQYGHGTGTGGFVQGRDYINPALRPVFDKIAEDGWKVVTSA